MNALAVQSTHINEDRPELGEAYASSVARLQTLVERECVEIKPDSPTPETRPATPARPARFNRPSRSIPPAAEANRQPVDPDNGNGNNGGGNGNGNGNGNNGGEPPGQGNDARR